jgi:hypothetical protein
VIADRQWRTVKVEDKQNEELLRLSKQILKLTQAIHGDTNSQPEAVSPSGNSATDDQSR